jgi:hypothetical protein
MTPLVKIQVYSIQVPYHIASTFFESVVFVQHRFDHGVIMADPRKMATILEYSGQVLSD